MNAGDLLTVRKALEILPIGRSTLYSLISEHQIPSIRVKRTGSSRGRILIRREDLDAFIKRSQSVRRALLTQSQGNER